MLDSRDLIGVINAAIGNGTEYKIESPDMKAFVEFARMHQVYGMMLYGLSALGISSADTSVLRQGAYAEAVLNEIQLAEFEKITEKLNSEGIAYVALKGITLKKLYERPEMRTMSDIDMLIRLNEYPRIREIMNELEFSEQYESNHELVWKKGNVTVEFHKHLIPTYNTDYATYYSDEWQFAQKTENGWGFAPEDEFIFVFLHFTKHYRDGGIGVKQLIDLWKLKKRGISEEYVVKELEKLELTEFYNNVMLTIKYWFENGKSNEAVDIITETILRNGAYGTTVSKRESQGVREADGGKIGSFKVRCGMFFKHVFPSYYSLKRAYRLLNISPVFLPVVWVIRIFKVIFTPRKFRDGMKRLDEYSSENAVLAEKRLNAVGLKFGFKEKK